MVFSNGTLRIGTPRPFRRARICCIVSFTADSLIVSRASALVIDITDADAEQITSVVRDMVIKGFNYLSWKSISSIN
jgi:hypothetical protein